MPSGVRAADVPIVLGYIDWPNRTGGFGPTFKLTGDVHADMEVRLGQSM